MSDKNNDIDEFIVNEEVGEILREMPSGVFRWGNGIFLSVMLILLLISWLIPYPDTVKGDITIYSEVPPVDIYAKSDGQLSLFVKDKDTIAMNQLLGSIKDTRITNNVLKLEALLKKFETHSNFILPQISSTIDATSLDEIQNSYRAMVESSNIYTAELMSQKPILKTKELRQSEETLGKLSESIALQFRLLKNELELTRRSFIRDSILLSQHSLSPTEFESSNKAYIAKQRELEQMNQVQMSNNLELFKVRSELSGVINENKESITASKLKFEANKNAVLNDIQSWKTKYLLMAPIRGKVSLNNFWTNDQFVRTNDNIFTVIPGNQTLKGRVQISIADYRKIKKGSAAIIYLQAYPYEEFGTLTGVISSISDVPQDDKYNVMLDITSLKTSFNREIEFKQGMKGNISILVTDGRLLERVFLNFKKAFREEN